MSSRWAKVEVHSLFNKQISKAQTLGEKESQQAYNELYEPKLSTGYNIALDVLGQKLDSFKFSKLLEDKISKLSTSSAVDVKTAGNSKKTTKKL